MLICYIKRNKNLIFLFLGVIALSIDIVGQDLFEKKFLNQLKSELAPFPIPDFKPEMKSELRAPDRWEMIFNITADDKDIQSVLMNYYRENEYSRLQWMNLWYSRCEITWRSIADSLNLPVSASYFPLMLASTDDSNAPWSGNCSCPNSGQILTELTNSSDSPNLFLEELELVYSNSDRSAELGESESFNVWLHELRIVIRLIENLELPEYEMFWHSKHIVRKGETLYRLSVIYGVSVQAIQKENELGMSTAISEGAILSIPEKL